MSDQRQTESKMPDSRPLDVQPKWRHDFPVDVAREEDIERRDFVKFMVLVSAAFATGQVWVVAKEMRRRGAEPDAPTALAKVSDIAVGSAHSFNYPTDHDPAILVRVDEKTFLAYHQKCTHLSCAVIPQVEQNCFFCPCHEGRFDMLTGEPTAGPPRRPLPRVKLEVRNGTIYATGVELRT